VSYLLPIACLLAACARPEPAPAATPRLIWVRGFEGDSLEASLEGLWWQLSLLGAAPPADGSALAALEADGDRAVLELDVDALELPAEAREVLGDALEELADSDEARVFGGVDLGRALMLTLYDPWRYYAISGACDTLDDWRAERLDGPTAGFAVTDSLLVPGDREVEFDLDPSAEVRLAFQASEGEGSLMDGSFQAEEHEVLDLMDNGQQRFAVYDSAGALLPAATFSAAGQPGRCMWCHEGHMQILSDGNEAVPGYLSPAQFQEQLDASEEWMEQVRDRSPSPVPWQDPDVHARGELLVETFLAPSPGRLAREWGLTEARVRAGLSDLGLPWHLSDEYPEQGPLLRRADLDARMSVLLPWIRAEGGQVGEVGGGFEPLDVLDSARELDPSAFPDLEGAGQGLSREGCPP